MIKSPERSSSSCPEAPPWSAFKPASVLGPRLLSTYFTGSTRENLLESSLLSKKQVVEPVLWTGDPRLSHRLVSAPVDGLTGIRNPLFGHSTLRVVAKLNPSH